MDGGHQEVGEQVAQPDRRIRVVFAGKLTLGGGLARVLGGNMLYSDWGRLLAERFLPRDSETTEREWAALKEQLSAGQSVTGTVIAKAPFGAWVDINVGFPALLEIVAMAGLTPERYSADDWCPLGSAVTAVVGGFRDDANQIGLWQVPLGKRNA
jgi:hypothetical protein